MKNSLVKSNLELDFRQDVEIAILNIENSKSRPKLLEKQVEAIEESFRINQAILENGVSNRIEYIFNKNNLETAQITLSNANLT